ncbi:MAG TPA: NAD-dependent epimerase/dehydratase family protein [Ktedonobacterales bacterium]|jgi:nucleoside-diphosphate-sugar epimerase
MRVLVTGATGFLGWRLAAALVEHGHHVRVLVRNPGADDALIVNGAEVWRGDLRDQEAVIAACEGMEVVQHAGALSAPWGPKAEFYATNVGGTQAVLEGCQRYGVRRLIYVSSPSVVFDGQDQHNLTETAPYPATCVSVYSHTKKLGEDLVNAARGDLETVILRPKAIFGPGDRALLPRMLATARTGRLPMIGDGRNLVDLTYVENVVEAMRLAMTADAAVGKTYHITNDEHALLWRLVRRILQELKLPPPRLRISLPAALAAAGAMERVARVTGREPTLTRYSALILARTQTYNIAAAKRDLGYHPPISLEEGIELTLSALRLDQLRQITDDIRMAYKRAWARV